MVNDLVWTLQIVRANAIQSMKRNQLCFYRQARIASPITSTRKYLGRSQPGRVLNALGASQIKLAGAENRPICDILFISTTSLVSGWQRVHKLHSRFAHNNANPFHRQLCERRHRLDRRRKRGTHTL
ncbi:hypothetical protein P0R31_37815 [Bradyrhizobium yuanmingense]|uniref:hypothetical protein n=1 Tax=Bradyrhizobium yuanmingense TaxID=108015 RepID=UPI0023B8F8E5|nr:hypothetical protein [Bradyrhizobium yuanmingense]MDF0522988.1 hypothetical protein [Bradyrhizobium yuanmingense]